MAEKEIQEEIKKEDRDWSKRTTQLMAIATLFFAVCATFASLKAGAFSNKAILAQSQASDAWAYYQAKSMKESLYRIQLDELTVNTAVAGEQRATLQEKYARTADRYAGEQAQISEQAKGFETARDEAQVINQRFAGALTFLQIGILLLSLAALCKLIYFWYIGAAVGLFGAYSFLAALLQT